MRSSRKRWRLLAAMLAIPAWTGQVDERSFEERRDEVVAELVEELEQLSAWCLEGKVLRDRERVLLTILVFEPDHEEARKVLRFRRGDDGTWVQSSKYREPKNRNREKEQEFPIRLAELSGRFSERMRGLLEELPGADPLARRAEVVELVLALDPEDPGVRALNGEVRDGERWVLAETVRARERRAEIKALVRRELTASPQPLEVELGTDELALGVDWQLALAMPTLRVVGRGARDHLVTVARVNHAVGGFHRGLFGAETTHYPGYRIFLMLPADQRPFLENHPDVEPEQLEFLLSLVGSGIPGTANQAQWHADVPRQLDGSVRHTLAGFLRDAYGIKPEHGWVWEGFGIYLTWRLVGTRLTWYVAAQESHRTSDFLIPRARLLEPKTNWMNEAYQVLRGPKPPSLRLVLQREVSDLTMGEMLAAYALAAYLIEGRPDETPDVLRAVGAGQGPEETFRSTLGLGLDELELRLIRWLGERR